MSKQSASMARNFSISNIGSVMNSVRGHSEGPKSLNFAVRRAENLRIERENHHFAKKLYENTGIISKKKHDEFVERQERYKKNV